MKAAPRVPILALALLAGACTDRACGGLGGMPPAPLPMVKQGNREFYLLVLRATCVNMTMWVCERIEKPGKVIYRARPCLR
jgi:hypothetical protein